jgi:hypothetical protein
MPRKPAAPLWRSGRCPCAKPSPGAQGPGAHENAFGAATFNFRAPAPRLYLTIL